MHPVAYYWISIAAEATGNSMMKDRYDQMAKEELPEEEYLKVQNRWRYERIRKNKNN